VIYVIDSGTFYILIYATVYISLIRRRKGVVNNNSGKKLLWLMIAFTIPGSLQAVKEIILN
jgi:hypothetical protein